MQNITYNDTVITLNGPTYLDHNTKHGCHYTTLASDSDGNEYRVIWLVTDESLLLEADQCCDWSQPDYVKAEQ